MRCPDPATNPACAACELTHGPSLSLNESAEWKATKSKIINANIVQVHLDERSNSLIQWMKQHGVGTPAVIIEAASGMIGVNGEPFKILLGPEDISRVRTDHEEFLRMLQARITAAGLQNVKVDVA
ncbi:hypothetical protein N7539_004462 [Penicillium diatomitis]|uniref:Uncharacterized protein n=1 Tax=Penicillium diatomitis TaxID=2819901 RepID=A0A9W9XE26_9EURO|nr:uncharacterized protein N7539_004462 [Penicillium diatomitis]KAJ5489572.1 hypothetical protein N7539_004462 [Penicillium diatomitis]